MESDRCQKLCGLRGRQVQENQAFPSKYNKHCKLGRRTPLNFATTIPRVKTIYPQWFCKPQCSTEYIIRVPVQGTDMTQLTGDETYLASPAYQTKGSSGTSEIYWSTGCPDGAKLLSLESGGFAMPALESNTPPDLYSLQSNNGALLESQLRLDKNGDSNLSDTPQNCHLHIG